MPIRSTYSPKGVLEEIRDALNAISATETTSSSSIAEAVDKLDEGNEELKRIRTGHELHTWGQEVEETLE